MAEDPNDIAADIVRDAEVLDYRPSFNRDPPLGIPETLDHTTTYPGGQTIHAGAAHTIALLATYNDITALAAWYEAALPIYRNALAPLTVPVVSDAVSATDQAALKSIYGDSLTFATVYDAYLNPTQPFASQIMTAWNRYQFSINGRVDAQMYFLLDQAATVYLPVIKQSAVSLIAVTGYAMLGLADTMSTQSQLALLAQQVASGDYAIDARRLAPYVKLQDTIAAQTSELTYQAGVVVGIIAQQLQFPADAGKLTAELGCSLDNVSRSSGTGLDEIIQILQGLETLYEIAQASDWLSWQGLEAKLKQLAENLILALISEAAVALGHVAAQLAAPLTSLILKINSMLCSYTTEATDRALNALTMIMEQQVGKFEKYVLDMYRHTHLANDLGTRQLTSTSANNKSRNLVNTVNMIISVLKTLEQIQSSGLGAAALNVVGTTAGAVASAAVDNAVTSTQGGNTFQPISVASVSAQVQTNLHNQVSGLVALPPLPSQTVNKPAPGTSIATVITTQPSPSLTISGTPDDVASGLLSNINGRGTA